MSLSAVVIEGEGELLTFRKWVKNTQRMTKIPFNNVFFYGIQIFSLYGPLLRALSTYVFHMSLSQIR